MEFFKNYLERISDRTAQVDLSLLDRVSSMVIDAHNKGGKVIIVGNGGSAAMASHISVDLTKNTGIRAMNFNEADLITCFANDYGYENWVQKALDFYAMDNDLIILISSSGQSKNILNAARKAKELGLHLVTFSGFKADNPLRSLGDLNFWVDDDAYNVVEMSHHIWLLAIVDHVIEQTELTAVGSKSEEVKI